MGVIPPYSMPVSDTAVSIERERNLASAKVFADDAVDISARRGQDEAGRVPHPLGPLRLHHDAVRRHVQADVVVLAERRGVGEFGSIGR